MRYEYQVRMQQRHLDAIVGALRFRQQLLEKECGDLGAAMLKDGKLIPWIASFWVVYNHPVDDAEREDAENGLLGFMGRT